MPDGSVSMPSNGLPLRPPQNHRLDNLNPGVSDQRQRILDRVMAAITDPQQLNERRERSYPRVVKRARHNHYPVKKPCQHGTRHDARATIKLANPILTSAKVRTAA